MTWTDSIHGRKRDLRIYVENLNKFEINPYNWDLGNARRGLSD
jgi:hypothetical protein